VLRLQQRGGVTVDVFDASATSGGDEIALDTGAGADVINIRGTLAGTSTTVRSGSDADVINVGSTAGVLPVEPGVIQNISGALDVVGSGDDTLNLDDSGDVIGRADAQLTDSK